MGKECLAWYERHLSNHTRVKVMRQWSNLQSEWSTAHLRGSRPPERATLNIGLVVPLVITVPSACVAQKNLHRTCVAQKSIVPHMCAASLQLLQKHLIKRQQQFFAVRDSPTQPRPTKSKTQPTLHPCLNPYTSLHAHFISCLLFSISTHLQGWSLKI